MIIRTLLTPDTIITITRVVKGTESRSVTTKTVAEALRHEPVGNDFATMGGTIVVSAQLADGSDTTVVYDGRCCYACIDDIDRTLVILPAEILDARISAGLTQTAAAELIGKTCRAWQYWESGERKMDAALFELFTMKIAPLFDARIAAAIANL